MNIESEENPLSPEKSERLQNDLEVSKVNDDATVINYIMLARIYDQLALIADALGKGEDMLNLINLHRQGQLISPPPIISTNSEDTE